MTNQVWVVGKHRGVSEHGTAWDFQGVFASRADAVAACVSVDYFIGPAVVGEGVEDEAAEWPGAEYPLA